MAIYQLGKVIRMMREAQGMTQDQFVEWYDVGVIGEKSLTEERINSDKINRRNEICSTQVLRRIENGTAKRIKKEVLYRLMEKLGLIPEHIYASILVTKFWGLNLKTDIYMCICNKEYERAERMLKKLKPMMVKEYPRNEQYLMESEAILAYRRKKIDAEEYVKVLFSALQQTVPMINEIDIAEWPFNWEEFFILFAIADAYRFVGEREKRLDLLLKLKENVEKKYMDRIYYVVWHTWCLAKLSRYMCTENRCEKSLEYCEIGIKECKEFRIVGKVHYLLYDNVWDKEQLMRKGLFIKEVICLEERELLIKKERVFCKKQLVQAYYLSKAQGDFINSERIKKLCEKNYPDEVKLI